MDIEAFITEIESLMELDENSLQEADLLASLSAWDSLAVIGYIAIVDEHFQRLVAPKDIANAKTIKDLYLLAQGSSIGS